ncbi:hypothetical protein ACFGWM_03330 [Pasteurella multocida]
MNKYKPEEVQSIILNNDIPFNHIQMDDIILKRAVMSKDTYRKLLIDEIKNPINWVRQIAIFLLSIINFIYKSIALGFSAFLILFVFNLSYFKELANSDEYVSIVIHHISIFSLVAILMILILELISTKRIVLVRNIFKEEIFRKL